MNTKMHVVMSTASVAYVSLIVVNASTRSPNTYACVPNAGDVVVNAS